MLPIIQTNVLCVVGLGTTVSPMCVLPSAAGATRLSGTTTAGFGVCALNDFVMPTDGMYAVRTNIITLNKMYHLAIGTGFQSHNFLPVNNLPHCG